jgi:predicted transcriptional regulator
MAKNTKSNKIGIEGIGKLEAEIMSTIWRLNKGVTVRDVYEEMRSQRKIAYTTIMTVMNNLSDKKLLKQDRAATAYIYTPTITNVEVATSIVENVVEKILNGSVAPLASYFTGKK